MKENDKATPSIVIEDDPYATYTGGPKIVIEDIFHRAARGAYHPWWHPRKVVIEQTSDGTIITNLAHLYKFEPEVFRALADRIEAKRIKQRKDRGSK